MKTIRTFLSENFQFLVVKFSIYLNRRVFVLCLRAVLILLFYGPSLFLQYMFCIPATIDVPKYYCKLRMFWSSFMFCLKLKKNEYQLLV